MYLHGQGVPKNDVKAVHWYRKAAEQGFAVAQSGLGTMYAKGEGVPENDAKAVCWFRMAAVKILTRYPFRLCLSPHLTSPNSRGGT